MPTPSTYQTVGMKVLEGLAPMVDSNGFIADIALKLKISAKTASYTVNLNESGTVFTTRGATAAVTFTLPAVASAAGCVYLFFNAVDFAMTIASAEGDNMIMKNDVDLDSIAFSTTSELIGGAAMIVGDGTSWLCFILSEELVTVTGAD